MKSGPVIIWVVFLVSVIIIPATRYLTLPSGNSTEGLVANVFAGTCVQLQQDTAFLRERPLADRVDIEGWLQVRGMMQQPLITDAEVLAVLGVARGHFSKLDLWKEPNYPIPLRADPGRVGSERVWIIQYCRGIRHPDATWTFFPKDISALLIEARFPHRIRGTMARPSPREEGGWIHQAPEWA